ncbi:MAG: hypothetical protein ACRD2Q_08395 [Terriglobales bacterium]
MNADSMARPDREAPSRVLRLLLLLAAIGLGGLRIWALRDLQGGDPTSYLDIADYYSRADWSRAINSFWSPLYSWLLALLLTVFRPAADWEYSLVACLNLVIYLASLACFLAFWKALDHLRRRSLDASLVGLGANSWLILGYDLFLWMSVLLIRPGIEAPDLLLATFIFLAAAALVRIHLGASPPRNQCLLGVALGLGFLTKAVMFPLAFVFAAVASPATTMRQRLKSAAAVLAAFAALAGPWIAVISFQQGRLTISDSPALNYAWHVNRAPMFHWQGDDAEEGVPGHTSRRILNHPSAFDFPEPRSGTYPAFFDPPYWNQGLRPRFDPAQQWQAIVFNARLYLLLLLSRADLLLGALLLTVIGRRTGFASRLRQYWFLMVPALAACGLFLLVHVERRYVAPYLVLLCGACFSVVRLPDTPRARMLMPAVVIALAGATALTLLLRLPEDWHNLRERPERVQWQLAQELEKQGVRPGDGIAVVGVALWNSSAARLARAQIIAEVPVRNLNEFWAADTTTRQRILETLAASGAKAAILECTAACLTPDPCTKLQNTSSFASPDRSILAVCPLAVQTLARRAQKPAKL